MYLERYLRDKYGLPVDGVDAAETSELLEIIDAEIVEEHPRLQSPTTEREELPPG